MLYQADPVSQISHVTHLLLGQMHWQILLCFMQLATLTM